MKSITSFHREFELCLQGDQFMNLSDRLVFGIVFPLMFCLVGGLFAKKGYNQLKTKRDKKVRCL